MKSVTSRLDARDLTTCDKNEAPSAGIPGALAGVLPHGPARAEPKEPAVTDDKHPAQKQDWKLKWLCNKQHTNASGVPLGIAVAATAVNVQLPDYLLEELRKLDIA